MPPTAIHLIGPGGAGKSTLGAQLAQRLGITFFDLDRLFAARHGDISEYLSARGYTAYVRHNVETSLDLRASETRSSVIALSSGFMTYEPSVHPEYTWVRHRVATSDTTRVLLPSLDLETCVAEIVRRQLGRSFHRSAAREEAVIRERFCIYRDLPAIKVETMRALSVVVEELATNVLPNQRLQPTAAR